jgi:hypothetical protein
LVEILFVKDQYSSKRIRKINKEFEGQERERIKKLTIEQDIEHEKLRVAKRRA